MQFYFFECVSLISHQTFLAEWSLDDLSSIIKVPPSILRRRIVFWQSRNILCEIRPGIFKLIEDEPKTIVDGDIQPVDEDIESAMASTIDQREEELQVSVFYTVVKLKRLTIAFFQGILVIYCWNAH